MKEGHHGQTNSVRGWNEKWDGETLGAGGGGAEGGTPRADKHREGMERLWGLKEEHHGQTNTERGWNEKWNGETVGEVGEG